MMVPWVSELLIGTFCTIISAQGLLVEKTPMNKLRPMPDREKYLHAFGMAGMYQKRVLPFVEERLGYEARHELKSVWQAAIIPIRMDDPDNQKYEAAYSNWLWMARCSHDFLADLLDREGIADYKRLLLQFYKRQHNNPDLAILRLFNNHTALAKAWAYEMQWMTPIELTENTRTHTTCVVHNCKILQTPASERVCRVDCKNVGTVLVRKVYHLKRVDIIADHGCTITLTPLED
jgi:hypothetical protein